MHSRKENQKQENEEEEDEELFGHQTIGSALLDKKEINNDDKKYEF